MSSASARPSARRRLIAGTVQLAVLVGAVVATTAFVSRDHRVTVSVDGQIRSVRTFSTTVRGALDAAGLTVGPHDEVTPSLDSHLGRGDEVVLERGRELNLTVDGTDEVVWTTATDVQDALTQLGLVRDGEYISASRSRPIGLAGASFELRLPQRVVVVHDGKAQAVTTTAPTVTAMLAAARIRLGRSDTMSVAGTTYPVAGMVVRITRITAGQIIADQVIPQTTSRVADASLYVGDETTVDEGTPGVIRLVYAVTYKDKKLVAKKLVSRTQTVAMQPRVVDYGTEARPVAQPVAQPVAETPSGSDGLNWPALANCESGGDPTLVSGNGEYYGLYQFSLSTWESVGGSGTPTEASSAEQTDRAEILYDRVGRSAWPTCGAYL